MGVSFVFAGSGAVVAGVFIAGITFFGLLRAMTDL